MEAGVRGPGAVARRRGSRFLLVVVDAHRILDERREVRGDDHRRRLARVISVAAARGDAIALASSRTYPWGREEVGLS